MISIVTPVYNSEEFIESCIQAVIEQGCSDLEHIIVDGKSTDRTVEIIKEYSRKYSHIRWISEKDKGQSDALNKGILMSKGEIIGILNVDDYYEPGILIKVQEIFKSLPIPSLLVGNCNVRDELENLIYINKPSNVRFPDLLLGDSINSFPHNPSAYFYHAEIHKIIGLYDINEDYAMDFDFIIRATQVAKVKYKDEVWGNFRYIPGTKTYTDKESGQAEERVSYLLESYIKQLSLMHLIEFRYKQKILNSGFVKYYFSGNLHEIIRKFRNKINRVLFSD